MKLMPLIALAAALQLTACALSPTEADYGTSVRLLGENQVYDPHTLVAPVIGSDGADPDMLNLAITSLRSAETDRKQVSKPVLVSIGGGGSQ